jgi:ABC-type nickel/cobalt efflux system permease component RcnA
MNIRVPIGWFAVLAGAFIAVKETAQQLGGSYAETSMLALMGGPHVPYVLNLLGCLLLIVMGVVLIRKAPKDDPRR